MQKRSVSRLFGRVATAIVVMLALAVELAPVGAAAGSLGVLVASSPAAEGESQPCVICRYLAQQSVLFDIPSIAAALTDPATGALPAPDTILATGLAKAAVFLLQVGSAASFHQDDLAVIRDYVRSGGSLVVAPSRDVCTGGSLAAANSLLQAVGATMRFGAVSAPGASAITQVPKVTDGLAGILLRCPVTVKASGQAVTLLRDTASSSSSAAQKGYGAMEQVGSGYVVILGAPVLSQEMPVEYDTLPFMVALISWLAERSSLCLQ